MTAALAPFLTDRVAEMIARNNQLMEDFRSLPAAAQIELAPQFNAVIARGEEIVRRWRSEDAQEDPAEDLLIKQLQSSEIF